MSNEKESPTVRFLDFDEKEPSVAGIGISEREAARQAWLDRERDREVNCYVFFILYCLYY